jgi:molybdenum cofactor guanylyltransferase
VKNSVAPDLTAFVLAGGKSSRMGRDKAFVEHDGETLLTTALTLARGVADQVCIVGSREKFAAFGVVVEDEFRDCGPLGGIHAALRSSETELNLMLAVDMPFVPAGFLQYLVLQARDAPMAYVIIPRPENRWQPLCAVYRRSFAEAAEEALRAGRNRIDLIFESTPLLVIDDEKLKHAGFSSDIFLNLNSPSDLASARNRKTAHTRSESRADA